MIHSIHRFTIDPCVANEQFSGAEIGIRPRQRTTPVCAASIGCAGINKCPIACGLAGALSLIVLVQTGLAQEATSADDAVLTELSGRAALFLEGISLGKHDQAYRDLLAGSELLKREQALTTLVTRTAELEANYGPYRGFERIAARRIGEDLTLMRYLYKCERCPVVWYIAFYRTPPTDGSSGQEGWRVITVRFDTDLERLLDD